MQFPYSVPDYKNTGKKEAEMRMEQQFALSNMFNKKGITLKKFVENKQKFVPILKEYSRKVNYKKDVKSFIVEVIKKLKN